jgi:glycerol-3-phosphate dehydrogenase
VVGTWAGLRPLVKAAVSERTADLSRRHRVAASASGVVSVTGGKLTTYRKMAADTMDVVVRQLGRGARRSPTKRLRLHGAANLAAVQSADAARRLGVDDATLRHLSERFGGDAPRVLDLARTDPSLCEPLVPGLPYLRAEAVWAVREEMACSLDDVLSRRTRALLRSRDATADAAADVAQLIAPELGWDDDEVERQVATFRAAVARERDAVTVIS